MWYVVAGAIVVVLLFLYWVTRGISSAPELFDLEGLSETQVLEGIDRILNTNRAANSGPRSSGSMSLVPSPVWRHEGAKVGRFMSALPAGLADAYYSDEAVARLNATETRALIVRSVGVAKSQFKRRYASIMDWVALFDQRDPKLPQLPGDLDYRKGDRALSLVLVDFAICLAAGAHAEQLEARWGLTSNEAASDRLALAIDVFFADFVNMSEASSAPNESTTIQPRFWTPQRAERHDALHEQLAEQLGQPASSIDFPEQRTLSIEGLPHPLSFVRDLGSHVAPLQGANETVDELRVLGEENLRRHHELPAVSELVGAILYVDPNDHGAAAVLLLPGLLSDEQSILVVAPSHASLILFEDDNVEAATKALALFEEEQRIAADGDSPIPQPVRVQPTGFEAASWPSELLH